MECDDTEIHCCGNFLIKNCRSSFLLSGKGGKQNNESKKNTVNVIMFCFAMQYVHPVCICK